MRLQARGCQIALEVLTLLQAGLADGAHACGSATILPQNKNGHL